MPFPPIVSGFPHSPHMVSGLHSSFFMLMALLPASFLGKAQPQVMEAGGRAGWDMPMLSKGTSNKSKGLLGEKRLGTSLALSSPSSKKMQMPHPAPVHTGSLWEHRRQELGSVSESWVTVSCAGTGTLRETVQGGISVSLSVREGNKVYFP